MFSSDGEYELAQQFIALSRGGGGRISSTFLSSVFLLKKVFIRLMFLSVFALSLKKVFIRVMCLSVFALVFLFSCSSMKSSIVPSRTANLGPSSILFLQKAARLLSSTVKYHRSCL